MKPRKRGETLNLFLNQEAVDRTPQRATGHAIAAAVLRPGTRPKSGPGRGTPCIEANRHDATPTPFDRHMPNIARVYPRVLLPESNSPPPQFPSVRRPSGSGYVDRGAWAIPRSRALGAIPAIEAREIREGKKTASVSGIPLSLAGLRRFDRRARHADAAPRVSDPSDPAYDAGERVPQDLVF